MHYNITLNNGRIILVAILDKPLFACTIPGEGNIQHKPYADIIATKGATIIEPDDPYYLYYTGFGPIHDEGCLFNIYRSLKNPIVKLERV